MSNSQGKTLDPESVARLPFEGDRPVFPELDASENDPFIRKLTASGRKWIVLTDHDDQPRRLLNARSCLSDLLIQGHAVSPGQYCHRPAVITDVTDTLDDALRRLVQQRGHGSGHDEPVILLWSPRAKQMMTGSDVLRCLLGGIANAPKDARKT